MPRSVASPHLTKHLQSPERLSRRLYDANASWFKAKHCVLSSSPTSGLLLLPDELPDAAAPSAPVPPPPEGAPPPAVAHRAWNGFRLGKFAISTGRRGNNLQQSYS